jgi:geranylgeranyl diphosphate synthase type II
LSFEDYLADRRALFERALQARLAELAPGVPARLVEAMRYSVDAGGKRLRPILALAAADLFGPVGGDRVAALAFACAVELVHTYSLIHDDLPCMDDDDLRRGRPTSHRVFGEALAILAGDALLTEAFGGLAALPPHLAAPLTAELARGAGARGMVGGQVMDIVAGARGREEVEEIHRRKTAALMAAAAAGGALSAGATPALAERLRRYGEQVGLAFQAADDALDVEGDPALRGKRRGGDAAAAKATLATTLGVAATRHHAEQHAARAEEALEGMPDADPLRELARFAARRTA